MNIIITLFNTNTKIHIKCNRWDNIIKDNNPVEIEEREK